MADVEPHFLNINQAALYLHTSRNHVYELIAAGYLTPVKLPLRRGRKIFRPHLDALALPQNIARQEGVHTR